MDNQEHLQALSRDEYIRLARESCTRNLSYNGNYKNHSGSKNKGYISTDKLKAWDQAETKHKFGFTDAGLNWAPVKIKSLLIRIICALVLFLAIFLIDKFDVNVKSLNSENIQNLVASDQSIDEAENFFVKLFDQFVKSGE